MAIKRRPGARHLRAAYRSGLEAAIAAALAAAKVPVAYEAVKLPFTQPEKRRTYSPDWILPNGLVIESKGQFASEDRLKHLWVKEQHPHIEIAFVFTNPQAKIRKGSPTTYADWCDKHGFRYSKKEIPKEWIQEPENQAALRALRTLGWSPSN